MDSSDTQIANEAEKHISSQPTAFLLGRFGLVAILICLLLAAWYGQIVITVLLGLVFTTAGLSRLWSRLSLEGVSCQRLFNEQRAFPGEQIELRLRVVNRKPLPLPWIQVSDEIPIGFAPGISLAPGSRPGYGLLSKSAALLWYTGVSWRYRLYCHKRGYYSLGPMIVTSGDIFGFYPRSATEHSTEHIIVYPEIFPVTRLGIPSRYPLGETGAERRIFEDSSRTGGVREYSPHDSLKRIHWKASARQGTLQSKVYEPTTTLKVALFLAVDSFRHDAMKGEDDFELGISVAASIASHVTGLGSPAGLYVNSRLADSGQPAVILPGSGTGQLVGILEALAKVTPLTSTPFEEFLQHERRGLPWGTTLIIIVSSPSEPLAGILNSLKERGNKILVIQVGKHAGSSIVPGITTYNIRQRGEPVKISPEEIQ